MLELVTIANWNFQNEKILIVCITIFGREICVLEIYALTNDVSSN